MHLLVLTAVIALLIVAYIKITASQVAQQSAAPGTKIPPREANRPVGAVCYISQGKLFYSDGDGPAKQIHSEHIQHVIDKMEERKKRHGWKDGTSWGTSFIGQGKHGAAYDKVDIQFTSAVFKDDHTLLYFLSDVTFGGLFEYDINTHRELRLLHRQNLRYRDLHYCPKRKQILAASHYDNGVANIVVMNEDGSAVRELTGGDTVDTAPAWASAEDDHIVFQSQGIARGPEGYVMALGPAKVELLELANGELTTVKEDGKTDFLQPRVAGSGELFFIARPYEAIKYSAGQALVDALFFPFRLLRAVFHYLNFFSLMYSRKPLTSASGPMMQADIKDIIVRGKRIDAEKALKKEKRVNGVPSLVPDSWQLIVRNQQGRERTVATNVGAYVISGDDSLLYTNGCGVFALEPGKAPGCLLQQDVIEDVIIQPS